MHVEYSRTQCRLQLPPPWETYSTMEQNYEFPLCTHKHGPRVTANTVHAEKCFGAPCIHTSFARFMGVSLAVLLFVTYHEKDTPSLTLKKIPRLWSHLIKTKKQNKVTEFIDIIKITILLLRH
jgi:hypothetical protein